MEGEVEPEIEIIAICTFIAENVPIPPGRFLSFPIYHFQETQELSAFLFLGGGVVAGWLLTTDTWAYDIDELMKRGGGEGNGQWESVFLATQHMQNFSNE